MKIIQKILCVLFFLLFRNHCFTQVIIDSNVEARYKAMVKKVPDEYQRIFRNDTSAAVREMQEEFGIGIFSIYRIDTLNKNELDPMFRKKSYTIEITDYDPKTGISSPPEKQKKYSYSDGVNTYIPVFISAVLKGDSVHILLPFAFEPQIENVFSRNGITSFYKDYRKYDSIFMIRSPGPKTNYIRLKMQTLRFIISDPVIEGGKVIYGEAELITPPFYTEDHFFKTGYLRQQLHFSYLFQIKILTAEEIRHKNL